MQDAQFRQRCARCENFSKIAQEPGSLYLWFPVKHSLTKTLQKLGQAGFEGQPLQDDQSLKIFIDSPCFERVSELLNSCLTEQEQQDTQALLMSGRAEPQLRDFPRVTSLRHVIGLSQADWLLDLLAADRITSYFQPIVYANDPSHIFAQEALLRGLAPDGSAIAPAKMLQVASNADILPQLDLAARRSAIHQAAKHQMQDYLFINFIPTSIYDPVACLRSTVVAVKEAGIPQDHVVFEVVESDHVQDVRHLKNILDFYREAGFLVALDDFGAGYSNLNLMHQLRPDFIKLDMDLIRNVHEDPYKALITQKILEIAQQLNIRTIAEGIETIEELNWVREHGATFAQGYLIAKPDTPPASFGFRLAA